MLWFINVSSPCRSGTHRHLYMTVFIFPWSWKKCEKRNPLNTIMHYFAVLHSNKSFNWRDHPGRYSHVKTCGDVPQLGVGFCKKSLYIWVPFFMKKTLTMGLILRQNLKKCVPFFGKIPKHGYLFLERLPLNMGMGPEIPAAHPRPIQI